MLTGETSCDGICAVWTPVLGNAPGWQSAEERILWDEFPNGQLYSKLVAAAAPPTLGLLWSQASYSGWLNTLNTPRML